VFPDARLAKAVVDVNTVPCKEYANYRPWSTSNVETENIRTVAAHEESTAGKTSSGDQVALHHE
jgi:hypothetical protein